MIEIEQEKRLIKAFKAMSLEGKFLVLERALLVKKIEEGILRQYGLTEPPKMAGGAA
jgi:hypothetical protein